MDLPNINKSAKNIANEIIENGKNQKNYGTGLFFEHYIVGSLNKLSIKSRLQYHLAVTSKISKVQVF